MFLFRLGNRRYLVLLLVPFRAVGSALAQRSYQEEDSKTQWDQERQAANAKADQEVHEILEAAYQFFNGFPHHALRLPPADLNRLQRRL